MKKSGWVALLAVLACGSPAGDDGGSGGGASTGDCVADAGCDLSNSKCNPSQCNDGQKEPPETDVDCGGVCSGCALNKTCAADADCVSSACDASSLKCVTSQCADHRRDGAE